MSFGRPSHRRSTSGGSVSVEARPETEEVDEGRVRAAQWLQQLQEAAALPLGTEEHSWEADLAGIMQHMTLEQVETAIALVRFHRQRREEQRRLADDADAHEREVGSILKLRGAAVAPRPGHRERRKDSSKMLKSQLKSSQPARGPAPPPGAPSSSSGGRSSRSPRSPARSSSQQADREMFLAGRPPSSSAEGGRSSSRDSKSPRAQRASSSGPVGRSAATPIVAARVPPREKLIALDMEQPCPLRTATTDSPTSSSSPRLPCISVGGADAVSSQTIFVHSPRSPFETPSATPLTSPRDTPVQHMYRTTLSRSASVSSASSSRSSSS